MRIDFHVHPSLKTIGSEKRFLNAMKRAKMDKAVLLPIDFLPGQLNRKLNSKRFRRLFRESYHFEIEQTGEDISFTDYLNSAHDLLDSDLQNSVVYDLCSKYPDKFIGFGSVNPSRGKKVIKETIDSFVRAGFRGVKIMPTLQFFNPTDKKMDAIYRRCAENNLILLVHTSCDPGPWEYLPMARDANPKYLAPVAAEYPDLKVVAAHIGSYSAYYPGVWWEEAMQLMENHENVYTDVAALWKERLFGKHQLLERTISRVGADRILFGSDYPVMSYPLVTAARTIDDSGIKGKKKIMGENAKRLLQL